MKRSVCLTRFRTQNRNALLLEALMEGVFI